MIDHKSKTCTGCGKSFTMAEILNSPEIEPIGITILTMDDSGIYFYFTHAAEECGSTFILRATDFKELIEEVIPEKTFLHTSNCECNCLNLDNQNNCGQYCGNAPYRRFFLKMVENRKKREAVPV